MRIKKLGKRSALVAGVSLVALLSACEGHNNPLKTATPETAAKFLVSASQAAEKELHVFNVPGGYYYGECMSGKMKKPLCTKLYKAMVRYGKATQTFQGMTTNDLTDQSVFNNVKEAYQREEFNTV